MAVGENYDKFGLSSQEVVTNVKGVEGDPVITSPENVKNITFTYTLNENFKYNFAVVFDDKLLEGTKIQRFDVWRARN
jgi:hypothetical protein